MFYYKSSNHGDRYVLSLAFRFSNYDNEHQFALFYPYTYTNLVDFISRWTVELKRITINSTIGQVNQTQQQIRKSPELMFARRSPVSPSDRVSPSGFRRAMIKDQQYYGEDVDFEAKVLLKTVLYKSLYLLSIKGVHSGVSRPVSIILCRSCGNLDSAASFVCQGLVDYLLSEQPLTRVARQCMDVIVFPMMDPDSICAGNSRTDIMGQLKISQKILEMSKGIYANLATISEILERTCSRSGLRVVLIELSINLNLIGSRIIGTFYDDSLRMERHLSFPKLMARFADDFYMENCDFSKLDDNSSFMNNFSKLVPHRLQLQPMIS